MAGMLVKIVKNTVVKSQQTGVVVNKKEMVVNKDVVVNSGGQHAPVVVNKVVVNRSTDRHRKSVERARYQREWMRAKRARERGEE